ncbi:MAG: precorrin-2 C(20)-methyltransferase [Rhodobacteraceae bacterium]|nr:precorrin-2 C(20)-methyltransferase [Paracoccaceae bacterium]
MSGKLIGVGLGPGDPELLTIKAVRTIRAARVIAYPAPDDGHSFARSIAAEFMPRQAIELPIVIPIYDQRFPAAEIYDQAQQEIEGILNGGTDVVVLCQGDPLFYGSFMYLLARFAGRHEVDIVPGVTSLTACAAVAASPLCGRTSSLTVLTGTMNNQLLERKLGEGGSFAIVKIGRHLARVRQVLRELGMLEDSTYVSHATLPSQRMMPLADAPEDAPYFSTILVPGRFDLHGSTQA